MAKRKTCKGSCGKQYALSKFPKSATAKDGHLGYCSSCWGLRMSEARAKGPSTKIRPADADGSPAVASNGRKKAKNGHSGLDLFNQALSAANGTKEIWQVVAEDGDQKEFRGKNARRQAYRQALLWKLDGFECTLREIHEYKPSLRLEILGR